MQTTPPSPFSLANVRRFIAFRAFFNCRFYYPVFTVLFLDYGLTIEQFAILNTVWAFTIVLAEVPSGALADLLGRKHLLVTTAWLMIAEMVLLSFVPLGNSSLIFTVFLVNRVLSGLAEALASGADEAMAYDTLVAEGNPEDWPKVLDIQMRVRNFFYITTMTVGAFVYDPGTVNIVGMLYAGLIVRLRAAIKASSPALENSMLENDAFRQSITYFPGYLIIIILLVSATCLSHFHSHKKEKWTGHPP